MSYQTKHGEYILSDGKRIDFISTDPDYWTKEIRKELSNKTASQLDIAYIRTSLHKLLSQNQAIFGRLELLDEGYKELKDSFYVKIQKNGRKDKFEVIHIGEVIPKIVRETRRSRWRSRVIDVLYENKTVVYISAAIGSAILILFREQIINLLINILEMIKELTTK